MGDEQQGGGSVQRIILLVSTLNRHDALKEMLQSASRLRAADGLEARMVVVDNSPDNNLAQLSGIPDLGFSLTLAHEPRKGLSRARNKCLEYVEPGDIVCFIDDDVVLPESFLEDVASVFESNPGLKFFGGRVELYNEADQPVTIKTSTVPRTYDSNTLPYGFIHGCCMVMREEVIAAVGRFDEALGAGAPTNSGEDTDYMVRAARLGFEVRYCPSVFLYHNHGRREKDVALKLMRGYWVGHGAMYAKEFSSFRFQFARPFYYSFRHDLEDGIHVNGAKLAVREKYGQIAKGMYLYLKTKLTLR